MLVDKINKNDKIIISDLSHSSGLELLVNQALHGLHGTLALLGDEDFLGNQALLGTSSPVVGTPLCPSNINHIIVSLLKS